MKRKITDYFIRWKNQKSGRMPLLVYGARQVGKTYAIRSFGQQYYQNVAYFNLETNQAVSAYFSGSIEPKRIIQYLELESGERIEPDETLIVFDEIQSCERALTALKYFHEEAPEYHIICAGSLLGVAVNRDQYSFPVGNVDSVTLYPMDFEEFLWAVSEERLGNMIRFHYSECIALPDGLHKKALELFKQYLVVGGMPRAVSTYLESNSYLTVPDVQNNIINDYIADMAKYASPSESVRIRAAFDSIPVQLAKENKKFQYKRAQKGGTSAIFGASIEWLSFAGVVLKCERIEHGFMPVSVYRDLSAFKLYMGDVGLLTMKSGVSQHTLLSMGTIDNLFVCAVVENYVAQAFASKSYSLYYWTSGGVAELDFVLQKGDEIIAVEVKAGFHSKSRSMQQFSTKYQPSSLVRISSKNFGMNNGIQSVPHYAVFCI